MRSVQLLPLASEVISTTITAAKMGIILCFWLSLICVYNIKEDQVASDIEYCLYIVIKYTIVFLTWVVALPYDFPDSFDELSNNYFIGIL